jgi:hypothetical protein
VNDEGREMAPVNDEGREMAPGRQVEARQWLGVRASAFGIDSSFGFRASPLARGGQGPGPFLAPAWVGRNRMEPPTPARYTTITPRAEMGRERLRISDCGVNGETVPRPDPRHGRASLRSPGAPGSVGVTLFRQGYRGQAVRGGTYEKIPEIGILFPKIPCDQGLEGHGYECPRKYLVPGNTEPGDCIICLQSFFAMGTVKLSLVPGPARIPITGPGEEVTWPRLEQV